MYIINVLYPITNKDIVIETCYASLSSIVCRVGIKVLV